MFSIDIDTNKRMASHRASTGTVTLSDVFSCYGQAVNHVNFHPEFTTIWDLRACELGISLHDIVFLEVSAVDQWNTARPAGKTAWVASTAFEESIIKVLYGQHAWSQEWQTFSTLRAAKAWCAISTNAEPLSLRSWN